MGREQANDLGRLSDEYTEAFRSGMDMKLAQLEADKATLDAARRVAAEKRRQALLAINAQQTIAATLNINPGRMDRVALAHFDSDVRVAGVSSMEGRYKAILGQAHGRMAALIDTHARNIVGRIRNAAKLENVARAVLGETVDDPSARALAAAWRETAEILRLRFNAAGGTIARRDDWGLPQRHDSLAVRKVRFEEWRDFIAPQLDWSRMIDERTGAPFSAEAREMVLREVYDTIAQDGMNKATPGAAGQRKLADRRSDHRFLIFSSADNWLAYHKRFGEGTVFDVMLGHVDAMARDIAQMEVLGPNPSATRRWLGDVLAIAAARRDAAEGGGKWTARARAAQRAMLAQHETFNGTRNAPVSPALARAFGTARSVQTSSKLGSAALSALTDVSFSSVTSHFNGLPYANVLRRQLSLLDPANAQDRRLATELGLIAGEAANLMFAMQRYQDTANIPQSAQLVASFVIRASGLSAWTQAGKWAFGMEFMATLGRARGQTFGALDPRLRAALERYGLNAADWDAMRAVPPYEHKGALFLRPDDVEAAALAAGDRLGRDRATRLLELIHQETRFAVPEPTLAARAITSPGQAGTVTGELARTVMQFKAFPVSVLMTHMMRGVAGTMPEGFSRGRYLSEMFIGATMLGALVVQLRMIASGKDPQPMDDARFWGAAALQGGGAGIIGDFLFADQNRYGGGPLATLAGPTLGSVIDPVAKLTIGNAQQAVAGDETNLPREAWRFVESNLPAQNLWYTRLAWERLVDDTVRRHVDPDYRGAWRRMETRARRDLGTDYWWRPGETSPRRAPDLENAAGD